MNPEDNCNGNNTIYVYIKIARKGRNSKYFADKGGFELKSWQR